MESNSQELVKGIELAIELERQAQDFYKSKASETDNPIITAAFNFLSAQEHEHEEALEKVKISLEQMKELSTEVINELSAQPTPELKQFIKGEAGEQSKTGEQDEVSMLLWAMRAERRAEKLYTELEEKSMTDAGKKLFRFLKEFELGHYNLLDQMIDELDHSGEYLQS